MEGSARHSGSHSSAAPSSASAAAAFFKQAYTNGGTNGENAFTAYDDVFGGPPKYGVNPFALRAEKYSEIFESFRSGRACSVPMLDLPPFDDSAAAFDFAGFVYSEIFGGFDFGDIALSYDELFRRSDGSEESSDYAWTQVGTESPSKESDPSACSGRNQYFLNGDFHQTTDNKFNVSCHNLNMATTEDSNVIHVAQFSAVSGNSYMYEGSNLQKEVEEIYSSGAADDIIICEDYTGISVETQSKTASIPSHASDRKDERPHEINLSPTAISVSDVSLTTEPSHVPRTSRPPPTAVDRKTDPVNLMSDNKSPKSNAAKDLFDVSSLDFLNVELDTGSSAIAPTAAIKEAMDRAEVKLKSARKSMERKEDATKRKSMERKEDAGEGTRPITKNDMNGNGNVRMVFHESISRYDELQPKHESEYNLVKAFGKGMQDVSEASQVFPDPLRAQKNTANGAGKSLQRKIAKNQSSSEAAEKVDNRRGLEDTNQLEDKEEACSQKETEGRKRVVSPRDENLVVLNEALGQKEEQGKSGRKEKQQSDVWLKKGDMERRKRENEKCEKEGSETKLREVQKTEQCQKNVKEATISDCYEKKLKQSAEMDKFERLQVNTENNRTEKKIDAAHDLAAKSPKLGRPGNTDKIEDEFAEEEMEKPVQTSESENSQDMYEESAINEEQKMDKGDLHAELKSTEQDSYAGRHLNLESEYSTSSIGTLDETNNKVPKMTRECEDLQSSNLAARLDDKNIKPTAVTSECNEMLNDHAAEVMLVHEEKGLYRSRTLFGEIESKMAEVAHVYMSTKHLQKTVAPQSIIIERKSNDQKQSLPSNINQRVGKELKKEHLRKLDVEREREREKDGMGVELKTSVAHQRASAESNERVERAAVERETAEARQRAMAEARERLEKACAEAREKSLSEKASTESWWRTERAAVARATAEAREHAIEKAVAERDTSEAREQVERSASENFSSPLRDIGLRHTSSSDLWNSDKTDEVEGESAPRCTARLERHRRTVERVAKALAEKNTRDHVTQKEQVERNRLAESLDADIKRWCNGKEGNLRALLSTLQYILGPDGGWHPIPLTEVITSAAVKKAYRKATLCVHPDKLQQRGATIQQKYICEKVFDLLKDAWNRFNSEEM